MNLSEQLDDARSGSTAAQKYLFDLLADPMMAVCCRYVKNRADAEELLLDGFYKFFSHLAEFRYQGEAALYAWIKTIMVRECLMFLRRRHAFSVLVRADGDTKTCPAMPTPCPPCRPPRSSTSSCSCRSVTGRYSTSTSWRAWNIRRSPRRWVSQKARPGLSSVRPNNYYRKCYCKREYNMSNERTDEFLSWRGRLDQPDALPEQGLENHEASWQRLAERLREKPRRRLTGYWVAAACLLLALIPAVRFLHPRSPAIALRPTARQRTAVQKVEARPLAVEHPVSARAAIPRTELPLRTSLGLLRHGPPRSYPSGISAAPSRVLSPRPAPDSITGPTAPPYRRSRHRP
jgi:hypothetical protein